LVAQTLLSARQKSDEERTNRVPRRSLIPSLVILSEAKDLNLGKWLRLRFLAPKGIKGSE